MTRSLRIFYIALFLVTLLALGVWSVRSFMGFSTNADATVLNGRWTKAVETHYDDEFPIKRLGTNLWAALDFKLFNEGRPGVVLGRDQWLYSDEEFHPTVNEELNLQGNYALVEGVRQTLKEKGVKLVMAVVPAKVRLYPEHLGEVKPASIHANLYQDFHKRLAADLGAVVTARHEAEVTAGQRCDVAQAGAADGGADFGVAGVVDTHEG